MKIAVASDNRAVAAHFGYCREFSIFETEEAQITAVKTVANPGHRPGFLPKFLQGLGIKVIISGGMGQNAIQLFQEEGIQVVTGAEGSAEEVVQEYLQKKLPISSDPCR
ncbi:MAG: dinitrogenase iron-molybdenum cofactor [Firmicutes bacterium]|nr:dinitrogenase iron-molybdenum cofactor [Bacillota bacterium]